MRVVIVLFALLGAVIAGPRQTTRIVGGESTTIAQYPYMSSMHQWDGAMWKLECGGSLLTARSVLSAAHCYYGGTPSEWRVRLGSSFASSGGIVYNVASLILHEQYDDNTAANDVAVVVLASAAAIGGNIAKASIPGPNYRLEDMTPVYAIGWGALSPDGEISEQLQHVEVDIINHSICTERYLQLMEEHHASGNLNWNNAIDAGMVCSGVLDAGGRDACHGDSGGPVVFERNIVYGVNSWGDGCAHPHYPGVNARVSYYSDWIVQHASV